MVFTRDFVIYTGLLSIWSMGDANFVHLIENNPCLQIPNLKLVIITADLSRPGKVFMELQRWTSVVRKLYENCDKKYKQKSMLLLWLYCCVYDMEALVCF